jgi:hypothetical protein
MSQTNKHVGELLLILSGTVLLLSLALIFFTGSFFVWAAVKILYGVGVFLFLFNK